MSLSQETQEALCGLALSELPGEWVDAVWEGNFCEGAMVPLQLMERVMREEGWKKAVSACRQWVVKRKKGEKEPERHSLVEEEEYERGKFEYLTDPSKLLCYQFPIFLSIDGVSVGFWTILLESDISHKALLALLYCILEKEKQRRVDRVVAVYSAQLYLTLLQIRGKHEWDDHHFDPMLSATATRMP